MLALMISFLICLFICTDHQVLLDCGAVQADALTVDRLASLEKVYEFHLSHPPLFYLSICMASYCYYYYFMFFFWLVFRDSCGSSEIYFERRSRMAEFYQS